MIWANFKWTYDLKELYFNYTINGWILIINLTKLDLKVYNFEKCYSKIWIKSSSCPQNDKPSTIVLMIFSIPIKTVPILSSPTTTKTPKNP
jgi:hypothetical protein